MNPIKHTILFKVIFFFGDLINNIIHSHLPQHNLREHVYAFVHII